MATLVFRVSAQYDEVIRLRNEISKLEAQLKKMDVNKSPAAAKALETQLASARQQMMGLVTEAAKAGAVMEKDFKSKIYTASQSVNDFTQKIIDQKKVIKDVEYDVKRLGEAYKIALKRNPTGAAGLLSEYQSAKKALDEEKSTLFGLTQQQAGARLSVKRLKDEYSAFKEEAGEATDANEGMSLSLTKVLGVVGGVTALKGFVSELINVRGQFQQLEIAFSTMLKSKEKADKLMGELVNIAAKTPFDLQGIASSAKQMLAYGSSAENVGDELVMLGNVAAGVGSQLSDIAYLYGTLRTQGRAYAVDIRQFAGRGIPIYEELAKVLGVTKDKVSKLVKEGKVGFKEVEQAFKNMTSESGIYYNLMEEQSKSLTGQLSNLGDAWDSMLNEIGKNTQGIAASGISALKGLIENYETVGKVLLGLIATYGTHKTALFVARIAQDTLTARMQFAIVVAKAQTAAQTVLNTVMKANPYVLVATAVVGLVSAMWALYDGTSAAEKAQKRFNDEQQKFIDKEEERKRKVEELIRVIQDSTETEYTRIKAYEELQRYSPALVSAYSREEIATLNLAEAQKKLNVERDKNNYQNVIDNIEKAKSAIKKYTDARQAASLNPNSNNQVWIYTSKIDDAKKDLEKWQSALNELDRLKKQAEEEAKPVEVKLMEAENNREQIVQEYNAARQALQEAQEKLKNTPFSQIPLEIQLRFNNAQKALNESDNLIAGLKSEQSKSYKDAYNDAKKKYEAKLKAVEDAKKSTEKEYKKAVEELETAEKEYKELGGVTGSKLDRQENQTAKREESIRKQTDILSTLEERQALERAREAVDLENQVEQAKIDAMQDGAEKAEAQRKLNNKKELEAIDRQKEEYVQRVVQAEKEVFDAKEKLKASRDKNYKIKTFDSSSVSVDTSLFDAIYANTQKRQSNDKLSEIKQSMNEYLAAYGTYIDKRNAIIALGEEKKKGKNEWEQKSIDKETNSQLSKLDEEANRTTSAISQLFGDMKEKTLADLQEINERGKEALEFLKSGQWDASKGAELGITEANFKEWSQDPEKIEAATNAIKQNQEAIDELRPAYDKLTDGAKKFFAAGSDPKKVNEALQDIQDGLSGIMQTTSFLSDMFSSLGDSFGSDTLSGISDGLNIAMDAVNSTMQGAQAGSMFGPIGAAAGAAIGLVGSLASSIAQIHDKKNEKQIHKLQEQIDTLGKSYNKLGKEVDKAFSTDASELIEQQNEMLEQQKVLIQQQIAEEKDKKKTDDDRIKEWEEQLEAINEQIGENEEKAKEAITGTSVMSAIDEFAQAYADAWTNGTNAAEASTKAVQSLIKTSLLEFLKKKLSPDVEEFMSKMADYMADGILSPWEKAQLDGLKDKMDATASNYYNQVGDYFKEEEPQEQQSATSKGFESMSQDTADELNGRFTALQENGIRLEAESQKQTIAITELKGSVSALIAQASGIYNIADETRTILANSYLELQQIRENTGVVIKPITQMQKDIQEMKNTIKDRL